jgi:hypothetical protein
MSFTNFCASCEDLDTNRRPNTRRKHVDPTFDRHCPGVGDAPASSPPNQSRRQEHPTSRRRTRIAVNIADAERRHTRRAVESEMSVLDAIIHERSILRGSIGTLIARRVRRGRHGVAVSFTVQAINRPIRSREHPMDGRYAVTFKPDKPGKWMFHCHFRHHTSNAMMEGA